MEVREMILQTMRAAGQPLNAGRIAELTGLDRKVVERALALLKKDGDIVSPVRCRWEPAKKQVEE
ncbi:MAG: HTH domain-containing protein [Clostridia bacterium]|nr:HTH domain-containing protein [Clostridia bacterium]